MSGVIGLLGAKVFSWVCLGLVGLGGVLALWFGGKSSGKAAVQVQEQGKELENVGKAQGVRDEVGGVAGADLDGRLRKFER